MSPAIPFLFAGLIAWIVYRRVRRNVGRQKVWPRLIRIYLCTGSLLTLWVISLSFQSLNLLLGIAGGLLVGALLGRLGWRLTKFEETPDGHFYTPDTRIGIAISLLFIARIAYRFWMLRDAAASSGVHHFIRNPLTLFVFGLFAGYYIVYYIRLFIYTREKMLPVRRFVIDWLRSKAAR